MANILLDIDGVINAIYPSDKDKESSGHTGTWHQAFIGGYLFHWNQDVIDYFNDLFQRHNLVILSTWRQKAIDEVFPEVGLHIPDNHIVLDAKTDPEGIQPYTHVWWKSKFAFDFWKDHKDEPLVWIDDDIKLYKVQNQVWPTFGDSVLKISPTTARGISKEELGLIDEFLEETRDPSQA